MWQQNPTNTTTSTNNNNNDDETSNDNNTPPPPLLRLSHYLRNSWFPSVTDKFVCLASKHSLGSICL